jgi:hypothetical protein
MMNEQMMAADEIMAEQQQQLQQTQAMMQAVHQAMQEQSIAAAAAAQEQLVQGQAFFASVIAMQEQLAHQDMLMETMLEQLANQRRQTEESHTMVRDLHEIVRIQCVANQGPPPPMAQAVPTQAAQAAQAPLAAPMQQQPQAAPINPRWAAFYAPLHPPAAPMQQTAAPMQQPAAPMQQQPGNWPYPQIDGQPWWICVRAQGTWRCHYCLLCRLAFFVFCLFFFCFFVFLLVKQEVCPGYPRGIACARKQREVCH